MQSSSPPRQGAGHGSTNQESGKVQISRGGFVGAAGNTLDSEWDQVQRSALEELASTEQGPPANSSLHDEASRSLLDPGTAKVQFLRSSPGCAPGKVYSSKRANRQHRVRHQER